MANDRTTSLHSVLSVDERRAVERDLAERTPGRETLQKCYEAHGLKERGIAFSSFARYGRYIRTMTRNAWIRTLADKITNVQGLSRRNVGLVREQLFEALTTGEVSVNDLMKLTIAESNLTRAAVTDEQWDDKKRQAAAAIKAAEAKAGSDPQKALADVLDDIRNIYGLRSPAA